MQSFDNIHSDVKTQNGVRAIGPCTLFTVLIQGKKVVRSCIAKPQPGEQIACAALRSGAKFPSDTYGDTEFYSPSAIVNVSSLKEFRELSGSKRELQPA